MTAYDWTSTEGKALHVRLAKLAGWESTQETTSYDGTEIDYTIWRHEGGLFNHPPPAGELIRQLEAGMTEEQQHKYEYLMCQKLKVHDTYDSDDNYEGYPAGAFFVLITASDYIRAQAICETFENKP